MLRILKFFENNYIISYNGVAYIVYYFNDYIVIKLYTGRWQIWRPWKPYTSQDIPSSCKDEFEFMSQIKQALDANMFKLEKEYNDRQAKISSAADADEKWLYFVSPVPVENI